jgi:hypothetical protein
MPQVNDFDMSKYAHDFSGYVRAAEMRAQSMANIGQQIGAGITAFDTKRKEKKKKSEFENLVMPDLIKKYDGDVETAKKAASSLYSNPEAYGMVQEMRRLEQDQKKDDMTLEVLNALGSGNLSAQEAFAMGVSPEAIKDYTSATEGQTAKQFAESVTLAAESVGGTYDPAQRAIVVDESMIPFYGEKVIPLSDPMFEPYFATAKGRTMTGRGFDVLGTNNSAPVTQGQSAPSAPMSALESGSSPTFSSDIGSAISSIAQTPGNLDPTNPTISTGVPMEYTEPSLDISEVAGGAVSRMSDFFKRKLKENEAVRQSTYGY